MKIWCSLNEKDEGFLISDLDRNKKYYINSSTIGISKENGTEVALASNHKFKVYFPPIKDRLQNIDITDGTTSRAWQFRNINLDEFRNKISVDLSDYQKEYAYSTMRDGELSNATALFQAILEERPDDIQALNAMGIISYVIDNNSDAEYYFSQAIDAHPNNSLSYINRFQVRKYQKNYQQALQDISQALNIDNAQPDNYIARALLYIDMEEWEKAEQDLSKALITEDFKKDSTVYTYRAICRIQQGKKKSACEDIEMAYNLTDIKEDENDLKRMWNDCGC